MSGDLKYKIQHDFDRIALLNPQRWDHNNHYHSFLLSQLPIEGNTVLEIGCGTGEFSRLLAQRFERVIAIDLSPKMIEVAKQHSRQFPNIDFQVADILQWQFPKEKFDTIASIATFHHLPLENLLPCLKSALKPEGKLVILDLIEYTYPKDIVIDIISVAFNWIFQKLKNTNSKPTKEEIQAWREHGLTDEYPTLIEVKNIYQKFLKQAKIKKHLFWRYSIVWQK
ncbi:MAG: class I SAM-dependent methyltransferase [Cyanobacteria bacterium P01_C01_bin.72]